MALRLVVEIGGDSLSAFEYVLDEGQVTLGRNAACRVQIPLESISDKHLSFVRDGDGWLVADRGSTNGTRHNGELLEPDRYRPLADGDELRIVDVVVRVDVTSTAPATSLERSGQLARRMIENLMAKGPSAPTQAYLEVISGRDMGQKRPLSGLGATRVEGPNGAGERAWRLSDPAIEAPVAVHAAGSGFVLQGGPATVNGLAVGPAGAPLGSGDRVALGNTVLLFFDPLADKLTAQAPRLRPGVGSRRPALSPDDPVRPPTAQIVRLDRQEVVRTAIGLPLQGELDHELAHTGPASEDVDMESGRDAWGMVELALLALAILLFLGAAGVFLLLFGYF